MPAGDFATAGAHASGHFTVTQESKAPYPDDVLARLHADADAVIARYPQPRSALLPLLHLVQSVDGYVSGRGIAFCAERLDLETAEVSGVATFYTQYKRHPNGEYTVGVCTNTLCAIMGGDAIWEAVSDHLGVGHDETTPDGKITLERVECNAACDYAPVVMANWEFFDNQTIESTTRLVDDLREGKAVRPTRGADTVATFKDVSRVLAGFLDGRANEGVGAGDASLVGLRLAHRRGWTAPGSADSVGEEHQPETSGTDSGAADTTPGPGQVPVDSERRTGSTDSPSNEPDEHPADATASTPATDTTKETDDSPTKGGTA
jgi:NADH-quinone oxidoreductase subunit E